MHRKIWHHLTNSVTRSVIRATTTIATAVTTDLIVWWITHR